MVLRRMPIKSERGFVTTNTQRCRTRMKMLGPRPRSRCGGLPSPVWMDLARLAELFVRVSTDNRRVASRRLKSTPPIASRTRTAGSLIFLQLPAVFLASFPDFQRYLRFPQGSSGTRGCWYWRDPYSPRPQLKFREDAERSGWRCKEQHQ